MSQTHRTERIPFRFVQQILDLRLQYSEIVHTAFISDRTFSRVLKETFETFLNNDARSAQYLSLYVDELLRTSTSSGSGDGTHINMEQRLDDVLVVFRYLSDKDVFEDFYKQQLASRLLSGRLSSEELEQLMISKLKAECGHQFTSKLEAMFRNIELSQHLQEAFNREQEQGQVKDQGREQVPQIEINVLTSGVWPFPNVKACILPQGSAETGRPVH